MSRYKLKKEIIRVINNWNKIGKPISPPNQIKQEIVKQYGRKFSIGTFIETGTYLREMTNAVKDFFSEIYSIELDDKLYIKVKKLCQYKKSYNIYI